MKNNTVIVTVSSENIFRYNEYAIRKIVAKITFNK